jgi:hypothetical protein
MLIYSSDASGDLTAQAPGTLAAPQIVGPPVDQLVSAGDFASFSVVVANTSGVTFQWAFNGTDIAGASGDSLLLLAVSAADVGQYSVAVTNSAGSVTSSPATLALDSGKANPFPNWQLLDNNPATVQIVADGNNLYQLRNGGNIFKFTGPPLTGWQHLDNNPATIQIVASGGNLYQRHSGGAIFRFTGVPTGWQILDNNPATASIVAGGSNLYQLHNSGLIFKSTA